MAKEFNIYLNNRLTQCDIIVYSIPYRDGINIIHKLILDSGVDDCVLQKFISTDGTEAINIIQSVGGVYSNTFEKYDGQLNVLANVNNIYKAISSSVDTQVVVGNNLANLFYRSFVEGGTDLQVTATVSEMEIHFSLGSGSSDIVLGVDIDRGEVVTKYEKAHPAVALLSSLNESIRKFAKPSETATQLAVDVETIVRRYRLLSEPDEFNLSAIDDMTLEDLDYVIVDITSNNTATLGEAILGTMTLGSK